MGEMTLFGHLFFFKKIWRSTFWRGTFFDLLPVVVCFCPHVLKATEKGDWAPDPETEPEGYHDFSVPMDMRNPRKVHLLISLLRI